MLVSWDGNAISHGAKNAFQTHQVSPVYDQIVTGATGGRRRGHAFGDGYFSLLLGTFPIGGLRAAAETRRVALNEWMASMWEIGAYTDIPLTVRYPTFPSSQGHAVVSSSALNSQGKRITTLNSPRTDIEKGMYLTFVDGEDKRLFWVKKKPAGDQMELFPKLTLESGDTLQRAVDIRVQWTEDNPTDLYSTSPNQLINPVFNLIEVV